MKHISLVPALLAIGVTATAHAATPPLYDDFSGIEFDRTKWSEAEAWRDVENGKAKLGRWIYGSTASDSGVTLESWNLSVVDGGAPKVFAATLKVTEIVPNDGCAFNSAPSRPRARIIAAYFNILPGGPLPGDRTGDVLGIAQAVRASNSADAPGVFRVQGLVAECTAADCNSAAVLYSADLGTVNVGVPTTLQIAWDKKNNLFRFTRDKTTVVETPYTEADGTPPSLPFANLSLRNEAANCQSGPRVKSGLAAEFDNVRLAP